MVESACKWLIQQRFKDVGMRWSEAGFNHLLHLRLAWVNGEFDQMFAFEGVYFKAGSFTEQRFQPTKVSADLGVQFFPL